MKASTISAIYNALQKNYESAYEAWAEATKAKQSQDEINELLDNLRESRDLLDDFNIGGWRCG